VLPTKLKRIKLLVGHPTHQARLLLRVIPMRRVLLYSFPLCERVKWRFNVRVSSLYVPIKHRFWRLRCISSTVGIVLPSLLHCLDATLHTPDYWNYWFASCVHKSFPYRLRDVDTHPLTQLPCPTWILVWCAGCPVSHCFDWILVIIDLRRVGSSRVVSMLLHVLRNKRCR